MRIADFDYDLPEELIAQHPVVPRDASRLLVMQREGGRIAHRGFRDLPEYLREGDLLVLNDTRVLPARLLGHKAGTGGQAELLLLRTTGSDIWEGLARPGRRLPPGTTLVFGDDELLATILDVTPSGGRIVQLLPGPKAAGRSTYDLLHTLGELPLPPYITQGPAPRERGVYQTIYAREEGSSAAPTAGLHFTEEIFQQLAAKGVQKAFVTLHVGLGTFRPVQVEHAEEHEIHEEFFSVSAETAAAINETKARGGRIVAVGTTSTRTLESAVDAQGRVQALTAPTRLYILPGYRFQVVDVQITNFHMPRSTLLLLISAFAGQQQVMQAYRDAVRERYRFLSFGDAMLLV
ncbi:MAG TPA: tRNA preQ1(34) S-adenosylmethionine ribosyltransferase-isomerase QueA [Armatimonadota bacterium]|jgi:S-adenosylmethionine:tRNA ribosyltransferase-isomerase